MYSIGHRSPFHQNQHHKHFFAAGHDLSPAMDTHRRKSRKKRGLSIIERNRLLVIQKSQILARERIAQQAKAKEAERKKKSSKMLPHSRKILERARRRKRYQSEHAPFGRNSRDYSPEDIKRRLTTLRRHSSPTTTSLRKTQRKSNKTQTRSQSKSHHGQRIRSRSRSSSQSRSIQYVPKHSERPRSVSFAENINIQKQQNQTPSLPLHVDIPFVADELSDDVTRSDSKLFENTSPHERVQFMKREYENRLYRMEDRHRRISEGLKRKRMKMQELKKEDVEGANTFDVLYYVSSTFHRFMAGIRGNINANHDDTAGDMHLAVIRDWNEFVEDRMTESLQVAVSNLVTKKLRQLQVEHDGDLKRFKDEIKELKEQLERYSHSGGTGESQKESKNKSCESVCCVPTKVEQEKPEEVHSPILKEEEQTIKREESKVTEVQSKRKSKRRGKAKRRLSSKSSRTRSNSFIQMEKFKNEVRRIQHIQCMENDPNLSYEEMRFMQNYLNSLLSN